MVKIMEIGEIISDAFRYPFSNIKSLILYVILGIILGIAFGGTVGAVVVSNSVNNALGAVGLLFIGIIIILIIGFVISGFQLDILRYAINREDSAPSIDFIRQFFDGIKLFIVKFVYYIIPVIIGALLSVILQDWLSTIISIILFIIFTLAEFMGECRLAKNNDLANALSIGGAVADISKVGFVKLVMVVLVITVISLILYIISGALLHWNSIVGGIVSGIIGVYLVFFTGRATGLLYSEV